MRNIFTVNATQIVVSTAHPEALKSNVDGFPKIFDSRSYKATQQNPNGDEGVALNAALSEYHAEIVTLGTASNSNRLGWAVDIVRASDGKQLFYTHDGAFPDMTPQPEPEPEPEQE
jgi:hypothetical protein